MTVWVLMAWDGPRQFAESWEPIAVFDHEPTTLERGRALIYAHRRGDLPWGHPRGADRERDRWVDTLDVPRLLRITDLTDVRAVPGPIPQAEETTR